LDGNGDHGPMIKLLLMIVPVCLVGCTAPFTAASMGVWGVTGKGPSDHALSMATDSDCKTARVLTDDKVCQNSIDKQEWVFANRKR
jgi:hypothetical protein